MKNYDVKAEQRELSLVEICAVSGGTEEDKKDELLQAANDIDNDTSNRNNGSRPGTGTTGSNTATPIERRVGQAIDDAVEDGAFNLPFFSIDITEKATEDFLRGAVCGLTLTAICPVRSRTG